VGSQRLKRLFAFGCSFTQYHWPTWADILAREFDYFENWALSGGGNQFIFNSLNECVVKNSITANDLVAVMWTNVAREDRYVNNRWLVGGNIYTQSAYNKEFIKNFADPKGYIIRDLSLIHAAKKMLESYNVPYIFMSMMPIDNLNQYFVSPIRDVESIIEYYQPTISGIKPSVFETVFDSNWKSRPTRIKNDLHPLPSDHLEYIDSVLKEYTVGDETRSWVNTVTDRLIQKQDYSDLWQEKANFPKRW